MIIIDSKIMTSVTIFYYPEENIFKDSNDRAITGMIQLIPTHIIYLFKHHQKSTQYINRKYGIIVKLLYPIESGDMNEEENFEPETQ